MDSMTDIHRTNEMDKRELLEKINMPDGAVAVIDAVNARIGADRELRDRMEEIREKFFSGQDVKTDISSAAAENGLDADELSLAFLLNCTDETQRRLAGQGFDESVFTDSMRDLTIWTNFSRRSYGVWGIREFDWLSRTVRAELWRLGRLQFEFFEYEYDPYSAGGYSVAPGDTVMNVHIPADGPFPADARMESYKRAYAKFGVNTFICDSYLLYPPQEKYLDPASNVVSFIHEYHVVRQGKAYSLHNLRYLYGDRDSYDLSTLPRDTAMRRSFLRMIDETGDMGWGVGVLFFDGEKIIK